MLSDRPRRLACCVGYTRQPLDIKTIKGVTIQDSRGPCRLSAVMWVTSDVKQRRVKYLSLKNDDKYFIEHLKRLDITTHANVYWSYWTVLTVFVSVYIFVRFHTTGIDVCASAQHQWVKKVLEKLRYSSIFNSMLYRLKYMLNHYQMCVIQGS